MVPIPLFKGKPSVFCSRLDQLCLKASAHYTTKRSYIYTASHKQLCEQTLHTTRADCWALWRLHTHFTFCHSKLCAVEVHDQSWRFDVGILTTEWTHESRGQSCDWKTFVHGDTHHDSCRATASRVVCRGLWVLGITEVYSYCLFLKPVCPSGLSSLTTLSSLRW